MSEFLNGDVSKLHLRGVSISFHTISIAAFLTSTHTWSYTPEQKIQQ